LRFVRTLRGPHVRSGPSPFFGGPSGTGSDFIIDSPNSIWVGVFCFFETFFFSYVAGPFIQSTIFPSPFRKELVTRSIGEAFFLSVIEFPSNERTNGCFLPRAATRPATCATSIRQTVAFLCGLIINAFPFLLPFALSEAMLFFSTARPTLGRPCRFFFSLCLQKPQPPTKTPPPFSDSSSLPSRELSSSRVRFLRVIVGFLCGLLPSLWCRLSSF